MKRILFPVLLLLLVSCAVVLRAHAYGARTTGSFTMTNATGMQITATYAVMPAQPANIVLQITPSSAFTLNAHITDSKGKELMKLNPEAVTMRYVNSIDVSKLPAGNYFIEILYGKNNELNYRIPFTI